MKILLIQRVSFLFVLMTAFACSKDCESKDAVCSEVVPTNEACQAAFNRWFYNTEQNSCMEVSYSGCSQKGFASKTECETCKCK